MGQSNKSIWKEQMSKKMSKMFFDFGNYQSLPRVAVIEFKGKIGAEASSDMSFSNMKPYIDSAFSQQNLEAVILKINCPGGSPVQCELISTYIKSKIEATKIPVIAFVEEMAASGGYWIACTGSKIYAARSSIVGSIGVIMQSLGFDKVLKMLGVEPRIYTSGENKAIMNPLNPVTEDDEEIMQELLGDLHQQFIDYVKSSRGNRLSKDHDTLFSGQVWTANASVMQKLGLVIGIDHLDLYIQRTYSKNVLLVQFNKKTENFLDQLKKNFSLKFFSDMMQRQRVIPFYF